MVDQVVADPNEPSEFSSNSGEQPALSEALVVAQRPYQTRECSIPKQYHLERPDNYGIWAYQMKNVLQSDKLY